MSTTMPPNVPGSRRILPLHPTEHHLERVRALLHQDQYWVLRGAWRIYLDSSGSEGTVPVRSLQRDQQIAAAAWISQQRHALHAALEGGRIAPDGWIESLPLYRTLSHVHERSDLPGGWSTSMTSKPGL